MNRIGVFCASSDRMDNIYYEEAIKLGKWIGENKKTLVYGILATCRVMSHENGNLGVCGHTKGVFFDVYPHNC